MSVMFHDDSESNFGNAQRGFLEPLGFSEANQRPWPVYCKPVEAAARFNRLWEEELPGHSVFDLCLLGMGTDCHTASLFPGSPLLESSNDEPFAAVEVPSKGWRLTITPAGLQRCGRILVAVSGASKANALNLAFREKVDLKVIPVQILKDLLTGLFGLSTRKLLLAYNYLLRLDLYFSAIICNPIFAARKFIHF